MTKTVKRYVTGIKTQNKLRQVIENASFLKIKTKHTCCMLSLQVINFESHLFRMSVLKK